MDLRLYVVCILMLGCSVGYPELGGGYRFEENSRHELVIINGNFDYVIDANILKYVVNEKVIILAQRPRSVIPECQGNNSLKECKEAFEKSTYLQYWIIDKSQKEVIHGPYQEEEYLQKCRELGLPEYLQLKSAKLHS